MDDTGTVPATDAVVLRGVGKRYGDVVAVDGVDLTVPVGQVTALLGPNGAGKSSTVDILLGLRRPDRGSVRVLGGTPRAALDAGAVGAVLQDGQLVRDARVGELVRAVSALYPRPVPTTEIVARAGLAGLLDRRTDALSGGQAQRVRFALALAGGPRLLVLDEPTAGLDVATRRDFWDSVREYAAAGNTVLFSTHYLQEADETADRVVVLDRGRLIADGPTTAIKAMVADRVVRCTAPGVATERLAGLPGVVRVERHGEAARLRTTDSDATVRALVGELPQARDFEVTGAPLAEAFLSLTEGATSQGAGR